MASFSDTLKHAWSIFNNKDQFVNNYYETSSSYRPDRVRMTRGNERSIITAIYNRIAVDVASVNIKHVKLDENDRYTETMDSYLNDCLTVEANKDQTSRAFFQDVVMSMFDEGCIAIVPTHTTLNPDLSSSYDIGALRVGKIIEWYPDRVKVNVYNDKTGYKQDVVIAKKNVAIIENPFYAVMNEPNSTLQRLIRKLNLLDVVDEQTSAGKLDLIVQLPYVIKTEARRQQAQQRRKEIEEQLAGSKYGIAYTDGTEHITQLNRSLENNLMHEVELLTSMLYSQLNITEDVLSGKASEEIMLNYETRTVEPIVSNIVGEMKRKFLTKTARTQKQSIVFFKDPFKLVPVGKIADIADKFTRNEIMSSNEMRQVVGLIPSKDPKADELRNKNLNVSEGQEFVNTKEDEPVNKAENDSQKEGEIQNG